MSTLMKFELAPHELIFEAGGDYPANRKDAILQVANRTAGGKNQVETLGVKIRSRRIVFNEMSQADYFALINWSMNVTNGSELNFYFTDEYGEVGLVKLLTPDIDFNETSLQLYAGSIEVEYI